MGKNIDLQTLRKKGENLLNQGVALGDTSGKIQSIKERDIFALVSKNFEYTLLFEASEKEKVLKKLKKKNPNYSDVRCFQIMHAVRLYVALKPYLKTKVPAFYICPEGLDIRWIKYYLKQLLGTEYNDNKINIPREGLSPMFTKSNIADKIAAEIRGKSGKKPTAILTVSHFTRLKLI